MSLADWTIVVVSLAVLGYLSIRRRLQYWAKRKVPYLPDHAAVAEKMPNPKVSVMDYYGKIYWDLAPHKYGGYFNKFLSPVLIIRDPEYVKNVLTKDFNHFINRDFDFTNENRALFNLTDERWRVMRAKLTPFFTPGKLKISLDLMRESGQDLLEVIDTMNQHEGAIDMKDLCSRFTIDGICACALGLKSNTLKSPGSVFQSMGLKIFIMSLQSDFTEFFSAFAPKLGSFLTQTFTDKSVKRFFDKLVLDTMQHRKQHNMQQNDFLDLLAELKREISSKDERNANIELTESLIIAQGFTFFAAGYETSSRTLYFALHEMAKRKDIQAKVYEEIRLQTNDCKDELTFENLQQMTYLDQVINETLRLNPIMAILTRVCNKTYRLDENLTIEEGTRIKVSVMGLHMDPKYYDNPAEFNPENFSKEAKARRHQYTYLPFGLGPRMCIGMRFGLLQVKFGLAVLIKNYDVSLSSKTDGCLQFHNKSYTRVADGGVWLTLKKRIQLQD